MAVIPFEFSQLEWPPTLTSEQLEFLTTCNCIYVIPRTATRHAPPFMRPYPFCLCSSHPHFLNVHSGFSLKKMESSPPNR
ncbi:hypothetical protein SCLCIDRAFT_834054 [Scleroderma citrinum Foug A]|uniref:Uncharacterized protein n=1 Tax=Scleroderma citrinum Foug A TaxID=1036808 RepID=A0A0C3DNW1_9AGAM|nr:hypothetical protein SCLCIDRAFT_834054 [Scleroderma citrinum Foug A]